MSGPVPSPSMNGMIGRSGTWSLPSALRIGSPGGTVTMENAGMRTVKPESRGRFKRESGEWGLVRRPASAPHGGGRRLAPLGDERTERLAGVDAPVVAAGEHLLQPHVQDDEQVAAAHLLELQTGDAVMALTPADWQGLVAVAADDRLEWNLDGEVEVRRQERTAALDHVGTIALERVRHVVVAHTEEHADEPVREPVHEELQARIVHHLASRNEARSEGALGAIPEHVVVAHEVIWAVGAVGHHDRDRVPPERVEPAADRVPEAVD